MSGTQKYQMLALDIDGTIVGKDYLVPDRMKTAIRDAVAAGVLVSLITGRIRRSALRYAAECATNGPTVSHQGAIITAPDGSRNIHEERLDPATAVAALSQMRGTMAHLSVFADDEIWIEERSEWAEQYADRMKTSLRTTGSLDEIASSGPTVVLAVDDPERIAELTGTLRSSLGQNATVTRSLPHFCEVASVRATKANSLAEICSDYRISSEEVIAIGDGEGDVSMIEWAGLGVASGDAHPDAISVADIQVAGPERFGVAELIQDLLSEGKLGR